MMVHLGVRDRLLCREACVPSNTDNLINGRRAASLAEPPRRGYPRRDCGRLTDSSWKSETGASRLARCAASATCTASVQHVIALLAASV
jgi:hypothetical protein